MESKVEKIKKLHDLYKEGRISSEIFDRIKAEIIREDTDTAGLPATEPPTPEESRFIEIQQPKQPTGFAGAFKKKTSRKILTPFEPAPFLPQQPEPKKAKRPEPIPADEPDTPLIHSSDSFVDRYRIYFRITAVVLILGAVFYLYNSDKKGVNGYATPQEAAIQHFTGSSESSDLSSLAVYSLENEALALLGDKILQIRKAGDHWIVNKQSILIPDNTPESITLHYLVALKANDIRRAKGLGTPNTIKTLDMLIALDKLPVVTDIRDIRCVLKNSTADCSFCCRKSAPQKITLVNQTGNWLVDEIRDSYIKVDSVTAF